MTPRALRAAGIALSAFALAAGCGKFAGPKTHDEAMKAAKSAFTAGETRKVHELCGRALELANKARKGSQAILALECHAATAAATGKPGALLSAYASVIKAYPNDLANSVGRFRLRNEYALALQSAGKPDEAIAVLHEALAVYKGTGRAGVDTWWERMHLVRNLARLHARKGASAESAAYAIEWADEIEAYVARRPGGYNLRLGSGAALEALADVISTNNDPGRASKTRAVATEEKEGEAEFLAANPAAAGRCHRIGTAAGSFERCFAALP